MVHLAYFPRIQPFSSLEAHNAKLNFNYEEVILHSLKRAIPENFFEGKTHLERTESLNKILPIVHWQEVGSPCRQIIITSVFKYRLYASKFVYEMISRWLVPGKNLNIILTFASDFTFPDLGNMPYILTEMILEIEDEHDYATILKNLPIIATEIKMGVQSSDSAARILKIKGFNADDKIILIQQNISSLVKRRFYDFDRDIFDEMQHFFVLCSDEFRSLRDYKTMTRIICWQYLFRKSLQKEQKSIYPKRVCRVKFLSHQLEYSHKARPVLGILVGINYLLENEIFNERHLLNAVQEFLGNAQLVSNSLLTNQRSKEGALTLYVEIEKPSHNNFSLAEIKMLKERLPSELKERIEHLMHPIFMPRNEEEIMRNILTLSNQLNSIRDLPQVIISFEEQTDKKITFIVILMRVVKEDSESIEDKFKSSKSHVEFSLERVKEVGVMRKRHYKEANVFHLQLKKSNFLRRDHSLDLYKARQAVANELTKVIGPYRDYNGGMIEKENEIFFEFKDLLSQEGPYDEISVENFFYSLKPVVMRSVIDPQSLYKFYELFLSAFDEQQILNENYLLRYKRESDQVYVILLSHDASFKNHVKQVVNKLKIARFHLAYFELSLDGIECLGFLYRGDLPEKRNLFCSVIRQAMQTWSRNFSLIHH